ncbi:MAG TPA: phosphomannomutase/phosphoglucomutase, partial [Lamprocystis sp. (in: g-proteobacteria)]|nr:phosphomannomutase/phosphoglucomutase [Lamprocystis sp. (in: g-proteobacteria)]
MASAQRDDPRRKSADGKRPPGIGRYWLESWLGIAALLLLAAVLLFYLWMARSMADSRAQVDGAADALAANVATQMARTRAVIESWREDAELRAAFRRSGDPEALRSREVALMTRLPGALSIRLFAAEQTNAVEGVPSMSYAGLDLARQAVQTRTPTLIEVHKVGQSDVHLAAAVPVLSEAGERAVGVVHIALPMTMLPTPLGTAGGRGLILYQQVVGNAVANLGSTDAPTASPDHTAVIPGTRLRTAAWLRDLDLVDPWRLGLVGACYLLILALIGGILWLAHGAQRRAILLDCRGLTALLDDAANRRPLRRIKTRLAEFQEAHQQTLGLLRGLQSNRSVPPGSVAAPLQPEPQAPVPLPASDGLQPSSTLSEVGINVEEIELPDGFDPYHDQIEAIPAPAEPSPLTAAFDAGVASYGAPLAAVPAAIFRANDIRGVLDHQLTPAAMLAIGQAIGSEVVARGEHSVFVGRDCRPSGAALLESLVSGIRSAGPDVIDLGVVPTPLVYFACCHPQPRSGAIVTASHNPADYNGVKVVFNGESAQVDQIQALYRRILIGEVASGHGSYQVQDIIARYRHYVEQDVTLARALRVAIDCGNGTVSVVAPALLRALGCDVVELNTDMESGLPARMPNPAVPEAMRDLGDLVTATDADLGLAFDGDGDRLGVVDSQGRFIAADRVMMLLAVDVLSRHPGTDVIYDVKCTRHLAKEIRHASGRPVMWRTGHAPLKAKLRESGAFIAGELSGHFMFKERWFGFDDA